MRKQRKQKIGFFMALILCVLLMTACENQGAGLGRPSNPGQQTLEESEEETAEAPSSEAAAAEEEHGEEEATEKETIEEEKPKSFTLVPPTDLLAIEGFPAKVIQTNQEETVRNCFYAKALEEMLVKRTLPRIEGEPANRLAGEEGNVNAQPLNYALLDVNGDHKQELMLSYVKDDEEYTEVMEAYVFDPASESFQRLFSSHTPVRLFPNGVMETDAQEEVTLSGRERSRMITRYDPETREYGVLGTVEPWDLRAFPGRFGEDAFPDAVDENKNGIMYFLYDADGSGGETPVDEETKNKWTEKLTGGEEILVEWKSLTKENIDAEFLAVFSE